MVKRVSIVDDDLMIRKSATFLLSDKFEVVAFNSADEFAKNLTKMKDANELPDLLILDLMMPGSMDGGQLLKYMKKDSDYSAIPVLILSARNDAEEKEKLEENGAAAYMSKPFDFNELESEIIRLLEV